MTKTPLWRGIADALRADIAERRWLPGDKLPTEAELAARFGVNRHTVRHALTYLAEQGWTRSRRGAGTFVQTSPLDYPLSERVRFHQILDAAGRLPGKCILSIDTRSSTQSEAHGLALDPGAPVIAVHGLALADGLPIALAESLYPAARLPGFAEALRERNSVTAALELVGVADYVRLSTRISATTASVPQATHLGVTEGDPLLLTEAISATTEGEPIELGRTWFAGDKVALLVEPRSGSADARQ